MPPAERSSAAAMELAETRQALDRAREQIDLEVERRQKAHQAFEQLVSTERERMRKQLHDGLGQVLTSISFLASSLRARLKKCENGDAAELDEIIHLINEAIAESRAIAATCDDTPRSTAQRIS
jgi:signal transduction histidine kinase